MSAAVGAAKDASFKAHSDEDLKNNNGTNKVGEEPDQLPQNDDANYYDAEETELEEEDVEESNLEESHKELDLGPQFSLKEHLEKDRDDQSLRKWKEQLLGRVDMAAVGEKKDPEVKIVSLTIVSPGRPDNILPIPFTKDSKKSTFTLKEGSRFHLRFTFTVSNNIVSGLKYTNVVWKAGIRVDSRQKMFGTYSPREEPYTYDFDEEITPTGFFARGTYSARTKFVDDDKKCYLDASYQFEIQKNWPTHH